MATYPTLSVDPADEWGQQLKDYIDEGDGVRTTLSLSAGQSLSSGVWTDISWTTEEEDDPGAWSVAAPTQIVVPTGMTKVRISCTAGWTNSSSGARYLRFYNQTTDATLGGDLRPALNETLMSPSTAWIPVTPGDILTVRALATVASISFGPTGFSGGARVTFEWRP